MVVCDVVGKENPLLHHPTRPSGEGLVMLLRVDFWHNKDACVMRGAKGGSSTRGKQRGMIYINVI